MKWLEPYRKSLGNVAFLRLFAPYPPRKYGGKAQEMLPFLHISLQKNVGSCKPLNGNDTNVDALSLRRLPRANGKGHGHGNGDTADQKHQDVVEATAVYVVETSVHIEDLGNDEGIDGDQAERADLCEIVLQVTGGVVVLTSERRGTIEERVGNGGDDDDLSLSLLAG